MDAMGAIIVNVGDAAEQAPKLSGHRAAWAGGEARSPAAAPVPVTIPFLLRVGREREAVGISRGAGAWVEGKHGEAAIVGAAE